jgi:GDP-L-fucose synthase
MDEPMGDWRERRVLVTGGAGFLGTHVVERLRRAGCRHVLVVRSREHDLTSEAATARLFAEAGPVDTVFHLAGLVGGIGANVRRPADYCHRNLMMGLLVMREAWKAGARKLVAAGAGCGYPEQAPLPLAEGSFWDGFPQRESAPYSLAKRMLHVQALAYFDQHRFPVVVGVPGNIYGPHDNFDLEEAHVVPALVRRFAEAGDSAAEVVLWGSGAPTRDFVYVADVADGLVRAAEGYHRPALVNLASGRETSVQQVAETLARLSGFRGRIVWDRSRPDGQRRRVFDASKAQRELGWQARTSLEDGLAQTLRWYLANRGAARNQAARFA